MSRMLILLIAGRPVLGRIVTVSIVLAILGASVAALAFVLTWSWQFGIGVGGSRSEELWTYDKSSAQWQRYKPVEQDSVITFFFSHIRQIADCFCWGIMSSIAWSLRSLCWTGSVNFVRIIRRYTCPRRRTVLTRMHESLSRQAIYSCAWSTASGLELWAQVLDGEWMDYTRNLYTTHTNAMGLVTHYRRVATAEYGQLTIADHEDTPPTSRKSTPLQMQQIEDAPTSLAIEDITNEHHTTMTIQLTDSELDTETVRICNTSSASSSRSRSPCKSLCSRRAPMTGSK